MTFAVNINLEVSINEEAEEPEQAFGIEAMTKLYDLYRIPLERAGFSGSLSDLLEQWEEFI